MTRKVVELFRKARRKRQSRPCSSSLPARF